MAPRRDRRNYWKPALLLSVIGAVVVVLASPLGAVVKSETHSASPQTDAQLQNPGDTLGPDGKPGSRSTDRRAAARYAPGQLIVKYRDSVTESVASLVTHKKAFKLATTDASNSLDRLHAKYQVKAAKAIFRTDAEEATLPSRKLADLKKHHADRVARVKAQFSQRSKRAPKDAQIPDLSHVYLLEVPEETEIEAAAAEFSHDPHVAYAQPNYLVQALWTPNDPYYASSGSWGQPYEDLWGLKKIQAAQAWDLSQGEGVVVGVVDTGLDYNHPDIAANVWTNTTETPGNGLDDDGNGFVDDVRGWDFAYGDNNPQDGYGHGTHVSGTVAAIGNNGVGIVGVAPQATILPVKGLDDSGSGYSDWLANALHYAADNGADVINNSWGCGFCPSVPVFEEAVRYVHGLGVVVVFAAGNSNNDVANSSPQNQPETVVVSAFDQNDQKTFFTSFGTKVDVAAPGGGPNVAPPSVDPFRNILSLKAQGTGNADLMVGTDYLRNAGTSMAAPHASGLAALILSRHLEFTNEQIRWVMRLSADDVDVPGFDQNAGYGRINAARALDIQSLSLLDVQITEPSGGVTIGATTTVKIRGTAAGSGFVSYQLSYRGASSAVWVLLGGPSTIPVTNGVLGTWEVGALDQGTHIIRLAATNTEGFTFESFTDVLYERGVRAITNDPTKSHTYPAISGDNIAWLDYRRAAVTNNFPDLYFYDLSTNTERWLNPSNHLIDGNNFGLAISGEQIVWEEIHNDLGETFDYDTYVYDLSTSTMDVLSKPDFQRSPNINGTKLVWMDLRNEINDGSFNTNWDIYLYDLSSGTEHQITTDPVEQMYPAISGDYIVWLDHRDGKTEIHPERDVTRWDLYLYDLKTGAERWITTDAAKLSYGSYPAIDGDNIVWTDYRNGTLYPYLTNGDIYLYNVTTNTERQITPNPANQTAPAISGNRIVWSDRRNGNQDIYLYDLTTDTEQPITVQLADQTRPSIFGDRVVWMDWRGGGQWPDIYLYDPPSPPALDPISDQSISEGQLLTFSVSATDPDGDPLTLTARMANGDPLGSIGATFIDHSNGTGTFSWTPGQTGAYQVTFTATDPDGLSDSKTILVTATNQPPPLQLLDPDVTNDGLVRIDDILAAVNNYFKEGTTAWNPAADLNGDGRGRVDDILLAQAAYYVDGWPNGPVKLPEGKALTLYVTGTDPEAQPVTLSATSLPAGASFNPTSRKFTWTPSFSQAGAYTIAFVATDPDGLSATTNLALTVTNVPLAITSLTDSPDPFYPNSGQSTTMAASVNQPITSWTLSIKNSAGTEVRKFTYGGAAITTLTQVWNGKTAAGVRVANGTYTYTLSATAAADGTSATRSGPVTVQ